MAQDNEYVDYNEFISNKIWKTIKSYSDCIKYIIDKHHKGGVFEYDDGDMRRGYFKYNDKLYTVRTWTVHEKKNGANIIYSIFLTST